MLRQTGSHGGHSTWQNELLGGFCVACLVLVPGDYFVAQSLCFCCMTVGFSKSDVVQMMMGSKRPSPRHQSPDPVDVPATDAAIKRIRNDKLHD